MFNTVRRSAIAGIMVLACGLALVIAQPQVTATSTDDTTRSDWYTKKEIDTFLAEQQKQITTLEKKVNSLPTSSAFPFKLGILKGLTGIGGDGWNVYGGNKEGFAYEAKNQYPDMNDIVCVWHAVHIDNDHSGTDSYRSQVARVNDNPSNPSTTVVVTPYLNGKKSQNPASPVNLGKRVLQVYVLYK